MPENFPKIELTGEKDEHGHTIAKVSFNNDPLTAPISKSSVIFLEDGGLKIYGIEAFLEYYEPNGFDVLSSMIKTKEITDNKEN